MMIISLIRRVLARWPKGFEVIDIQPIKNNNQQHAIVKPDSCKIQNEKIDNMMTSSNGNIFRVTDPLCGEFTGHRWIPLTKANDAELWCFLWSAPEQTAE